MGQKVHPTGFRLGYLYDWKSKWYAERDYKTLLQEDIAIREAVTARLEEAAISHVDIDRNANQVTVTIFTARPGVVIGRGGQRVDEIRNRLEALTGRRIRVNIHEIRVPELDATLVAKNIAEQIERRVAYRRATKQAAARTMQRGALGIKISCSGRLGGAEMSRRYVERVGQVPLHTLRADIDYGFAEARTTLGRIGVKVWIYKGQVLPEARWEMEAPPQEALPSEQAAPEPAPVE